MCREPCQLAADAIHKYESRINDIQGWEYSPRCPRIHGAISEMQAAQLTAMDYRAGTIRLIYNYLYTRMAFCYLSVSLMHAIWACHSMDRHDMSTRLNSAAHALAWMLIFTNVAALMPNMPLYRIFTLVMSAGLIYMSDWPVVYAAVCIGMNLIGCCIALVAPHIIEAFKI